MVNGTSKYYAVRENGNSSIQIYHLSDIDTPIYEINKLHKEVLFYFDDELAIYCTRKYIMLYNSITQQHQPIASISSNLYDLVVQAYNDSNLYPFDNFVTNSLISNYMQYKFLPIVSSYPKNMCFLYTLDGNYIGEFNNIQDMLDYMKQEISKQNKLSCDMIRLY